MLTTSKSYYINLPFVKNGPKHHNAKEVVLHSTYVTVKVGNLERRNQIVVTVGRRIQFFLKMMHSRKSFLHLFVFEQVAFEPCAVCIARRISLDILRIMGQRNIVISRCQWCKRILSSFLGVAFFVREDFNPGADRDK